MAQKEFRKPPRYMVGDIVYSHGFICNLSQFIHK